MYLIGTTALAPMGERVASVASRVRGFNQDSEPLVVTLDVGTSSVRTLLFDANGCEVQGFGVHLPYQVVTTADGGVEVDGDELSELAVRSLCHIHAQMKASGLRPAAVGSCTFWHNVLGVGEDGRPTTPVIHLFDTRSANAAKRLAQRIDARQQHARTGCVLHASYLPAKLLWLSEARPDVFRATRRWMSFAEFLFLKLFGRAVTSTSMVSGSGLWNQHENNYDQGILSVLPIERSQLSSVEAMDRPLTDLRPEYGTRWPELAGVPWYPALGDGACNNIGSGCYSPERFALMVGTSGALRAVLEASHIDIPAGLWCYRVDRRRYVVGGALSNGGAVLQWMQRTLTLPSEEGLDTELAAITPGSHGLTILPFLAGERSTGWRAEARAAITGLSVHTSSIDILRAGLESVALRFRDIYEVMVERLGAPAQVVASGGALPLLPSWTQMMADALGRPVLTCLERETTSRGAALLALERMGAIRYLAELKTPMGRTFHPVPAHTGIYDQMLQRQRELYTRLFES
jgi:gluconokinase